MSVLTPMDSASLVAIALLSSGCDDVKSQSPPSLTRDNVGVVRQQFNRAIEEPRVIVFFSSGCQSCDTGSVALQNMLATLDAPVTVFAVWEPIAASDPAPTSRLLANIKDARVVQLWDPDHIMSDEMREAELAHPGSPPQAPTRTGKRSTGIMYDTIAVFPPGARWDATLPAPSWLDVGLEAKLDELRRRLVR